MKVKPMKLIPRTIRLRCCLLIAAAFAVALVQGQAPVALLQSDKPVYQPGETMTFSFSGGPGNAKDWIGIYKTGETPDGHPTATIWHYVDGTQDGNTGLSDGRVSFNGGLAEGDWTAYFLENDGYNALALASFKVVNPNPSVAADKKKYKPNEPIKITFSNGPANAKDWIAVYKTGETPGGPPATIWDYVDGTQTGSTGVANGTITFTSGLAADGNYTVYFLRDGAYTSIARTTLSISSAPDPTLISDHSNYFPDEPITFTFANGPPIRLLDLYRLRSGIMSTERRMGM
jgi:hypothetical protein